MGVACSCVRSQTKSSGTAEGQASAVDGATYNARHTAASSSQLFVVNGRTGRREYRLSQSATGLVAYTSNGRAVVLLTSPSHVPDLKALILDTLRLLRMLVTKYVEVTLHFCLNDYQVY